MKKIESKYHFSTSYKDHNEKEQQATVVLKINYNLREYEILPYSGPDAFKFIQTSHKWQMWKAVLKSINDAIDFANSELDIIGVKGNNGNQ